MSKVRVYEVARQLNVDQKTLVATLQSLGFAEVKNHMSAVDTDAIERVKRHLEKAKSPARVEERIRPTVVKRRAVAKPSRPEEPPPAPEPAPVVRKTVVKRQPKGLPPIPPLPESKTRLQEEPEQLAAIEQPPVAPVVEQEPPPVDSEPEPVAPAIAVEKIPTPPPPVEPVVDHEVAAAPEIEPEKEAPVPVEPVAHEEPAAEPVSPPVELEPAAAPEPIAAAGAPEPEEPVETRPASKPTSEPAPKPEPTPAPPRVAQSPRTGIETWAGRPGVPMPVAPSVRPPAGPIPRRVQYDPKAGAAGKPDPRAAANARKGPWANKGRRGPQGMGSQVRRPAAAPSTKEMSEHKKVIKIEEKVSLQTLAGRMSLKATEVLMKLLSMGMPGVNINSTLDADTAKLLASEFGWGVEDVAVSEEEALGIARGSEGEAEETDLITRPPIVTVMGHVDHGKTSLLDQIRKTNVAAQEAGGITQHIGAYRVTTPRGVITFLDTPGHAAFTAMRARGAQVTDIVILVVAADDGVMPQTREAVNHSRAAKVPIIVAVNKVDKPGSSPERVRRELADMQLVPEEWGGETIFVDVSAKTRQGVDQLLEMILLQAEVMDLKAGSARPAVGHVLEALLDRGRGPVARVLVTDGTLHTGDILLAGAAYGKVRAMTDDRGRMVAEAGPATPVEILGLSEVPNAGDPAHVVKDPKKAQEIALSRKSRVSKSLIPASAKVTLEELAKRMAESEHLELRLIIKADVQGSVEALAEALAQLSTEKVKVAIIHAAVGGITEGDVNLAVASKAIIVGFNVRTAGKAGSVAETESIEIRTYTVIYDAVDEIKKAMLGMLGPTKVEKNLGHAEVRQTFHIAKIGTVAGVMVQDGIIRRNAKVRLVRDAVQVWEGKFATVKRFKEDAREVEKGFECGVSFDGFSDIKVGDIVECYEVEEVAATL
ncbi:MAG: translation initiation factor IF-2 [Deltaproteobacteria bacterium]|nr:translation initiation factor IF-2 [Deltaproteobacteria bacterium]